VAFVPRLTLKATYTRLSPVDSSIGSGALVVSQTPGPIGTGPCPGGMGECVVDAGGLPVFATPLSFPTVVDNFALSAQLLVPLSDYALRVPDAVEGVGQAEAAAEQSIESARHRATLEGRLLYYGWIRSVGQEGIAAQALERATASLKDAEALASANVGRITRADLMRVQTLVKNTEQLVEDSRAFRRLAERSLAVMMNDPPTTRYRVGEDVMSVKRLGPLKEEALLREAFQRRTELRALDHTIKAIDASGGLARGAYYPRLDAFGELTYANPNPRIFPAAQAWNMTWAVGLSATWTVNDTVATVGASRDIDAQLEKLRSQREALQRGIRLEVSGAVVEAQRAERSIATAKAALESATEALRVATELYRVGQATTSDLLAAESELLRARFQALNAYVDAHVARSKLYHAVGRSLTRQR
jgi:outer membrane protein TolC